MTIIFDLIVLVGYISTLVLLGQSEKKLDQVEKKYNDLRVQYASLKSKRGVQDENN